MNYVGIPFRDGGRDRQGSDCWGLVRLVYADHGIELPSYGEISAAELMTVAREIGGSMDGGPWRRVDAEPRRLLDAVVMKRVGSASRAPIHVGVMLDARRLLHVEEATDSHLVPIDHWSVKGRIVGFFRHRDAA